jgi:hypothetical protein
MRLAEHIPAGSWAMAMGCGIVSIDLLLEGWPVPSAILLWLAVAVWAVLVVRWASSPGCAVREASSPPALGSVAATAVLGARFSAHGPVWIGSWACADGGLAFLVLAVLGLAVLLRPVASNWNTPTVGTSFLVSVAIQGVAALSATLAASYEATWLLYVSMALFLAGLAAYVIVVWRFDFRSVSTGAGDQWVAGGALAIGTLAAGKIAATAAALDVLGDGGRVGGGWLGWLALVLWCVAMAWLIPLVVSEFIRPRLRYHVLRWATVFPVGMYAACSFAVGQVTGLGGITDFARIWTPIAVAVTLAVLIGLARGTVADRTRPAVP